MASTPLPAGGYLVNRLVSAATTNATVVKAAKGQVFGWHVYNANAAVRFLKLYNKSSAPPTVGTDAPVVTISIPPGGALNVEVSGGIAFPAGIGMAITALVTDADTTAVAATEIVVNLFYV